MIIFTRCCLALEYAPITIIRTHCCINARYIGLIAFSVIGSYCFCSKYCSPSAIYCRACRVFTRD
ncbi:hypothetical protein OMAG_002553 [Candidatus Omnitrophus magneticus]|uniref:Uncharacterized protein n=1 Tax=Candidatus Omnitrophus magneticus TaxID=1609969 RepID=A0A0F0CQ72_9BACT|nr:hypothetical protein OMAG_002553 [Candidatus Omnitrophus magneticus]